MVGLSSLCLPSGLTHERARSQTLLLAAVASLVSLALGADWTCSKDDIAANDGFFPSLHPLPSSASKWVCAGNICCNKGVEVRMKKLLEQEANLHAAAVEIRDVMETEFGDHWEAVVAYEDFGYASYRQGLFHCKYTADDGKAAMVWKVRLPPFTLSHLLPTAEERPLEVFNAVNKEREDLDGFFEEEDKEAKKAEPKAIPTTLTTHDPRVSPPVAAASARVPLQAQGQVHAQGPARAQGEDGEAQAQAHHGPPHPRPHHAQAHHEKAGMPLLFPSSVLDEEGEGAVAEGEDAEREAARVLHLQGEPHPRLLLQRGQPEAQPLQLRQPQRPRRPLSLPLLLRGWGLS